MKFLMPTRNVCYSAVRSLWGRGSQALLSCGLIGWAVFSAGCDKKQDSQAGDSIILAQIGENTFITADDLLEEIEYRQSQGRPVPNAQDVLEEMVQRESLVHRAEQLNLHEDEEVRRTWENLLIGRLQALELEGELANVSISDEEIAKAYETEFAAEKPQNKVRLAILFREWTPELSDEEDREIRGQLLAAVQEYKNNPPIPGRAASAQGFGDVAARVSEDQVSRYRGGDIGWFDEGQVTDRLPEEVFRQAYTLEEGEPSDIIEAGDGLYVVMKSDFREPSAPTLEQSEVLIRHNLLREKRERMKEDFISQSVAMAEAEIFAERLDEVEFPPEMQEMMDSETDLPEAPSLPDGRSLSGDPSVLSSDSTQNRAGS